MKINGQLDPEKIEDIAANQAISYLVGVHRCL